jgi:hypothetical protein
MVRARRDPDHSVLLILIRVLAAHKDGRDPRGQIADAQLAMRVETEGDDATRGGEKEGVMKTTGNGGNFQVRRRQNNPARRQAVQLSHFFVLQEQLLLLLLLVMIFALLPLDSFPHRRDVNTAAAGSFLLCNDKPGEGVDIFAAATPAAQPAAAS